MRGCADKLADSVAINGSIDERDFLTACELIKRAMGVHDFVQVVQQEFQQPAYKHAKIHEYIYGLDVSVVASPNFDNIYETYASAVSAGSVVIKDHTSNDIGSYLLGGESRLIIKTHGSANNPQDVIFTRMDYAQARTKFMLFYEILKSLVMTHTFLFIGCGVDDPDIRMLFEDVQFAYGRMPFHYMTLPRGTAHADVLRVISELMHVQFLEYSSDDGHLELTGSLGELVERVEELRSEISLNRRW
ncbi:SIR2 family protein [Rhodanobacter sp. DHB23]|uniref:SIR2 family NAD-dependent protein deacylase n=1 Tax=Rhodanobacter sp. DHB23 TaxID=2775923 RepID=UPI001CE12EA2|nr:SIR2 family protein [Rhodanobacter sp. DHB23]